MNTQDRIMAILTPGTMFNINGRVWRSMSTLCAYCEMESDPLLELLSAEFNDTVVLKPSDKKGILIALKANIPPPEQENAPIVIAGGNVIAAHSHPVPGVEEVVGSVNASADFEGADESELSIESEDIPPPASIANPCAEVLVGIAGLENDPNHSFNPSHLDVVDDEPVKIKESAPFYLPLGAVGNYQIPELHGAPGPIATAVEETNQIIQPAIGLHAPVLIHGFLNPPKESKAGAEANDGIDFLDGV